MEVYPRARCSAAKSVSGSMGLAIWSCIPALRHFSASPFMVWAVMAIMGMSGRKARIRRVASMPYQFRHLDVHEDPMS